MSQSFYQKVKVLDSIKDIQNPSEDQIKVTIQLISEEKYANYFFLDLQNSFWVNPLHRINYFYHTPEPIEVQKGSFILPGWQAGEYLSRFADQYEQIVFDVVRSSKTENWRVQEILIDAMLRISPSKAAELVPIIDSWLSSRFSNLLPNKLLQLANRFLDTGLDTAALKLFEYVFTPFVIPGKDEDHGYRDPVKFRSDQYWVNEYFTNQFIKLVQANPTQLALVFERQLLKVIELVKQVEPGKAEIRVGYHWRLDIPNRSSDHGNPDALDILIDGMRDSLAEVCKVSIDDGKEFLSRYLSSGHIIFIRIALFTLRKFGLTYPDLIEYALLHHEYLEDSEYGKEYRGLLRDQFDTARDKVKTQVVSWILSGPIDVDSRTKWWVGDREVTENDRRETQEYWRLRHLEIIRNFLPENVLSYLDELVAKHGKPDIEERPNIVTPTWGGAPSPVTENDLSNMTFDELKSYFLAFEPSDLFMNPRESLAQTFQRIVSQNPSQYSQFASYLNNTNIRFVYIYHYLSGIREGLKENNGKITKEILGLCEYVVSQNSDPFKESSGDYEPGLFAAQLEVANLLEVALRSDDTYLTREELDRIRALLISLAHHPNPDIDAERETSFNPFTYSLNCVRGIAMHGIFQYSLYVVRQADKLSGNERENRIIEPEVARLLAEKLDLSNDSSLAVHSVFGVYLTKLFFLDREWLELNLNQIFPDDETKNDYWKAAWDAYIFANNVHRELFQLLIPHYQRGLRYVNQPTDEEKNFGGSSDERFAQHIMFAYLADLTDFDHENHILDLFFANARDLLRAQGISWLGEVLKSEKPKLEDPLWKKCWGLWYKRLEFSETQDPELDSQEISEYIRWLEYCPLELGDLFAILEATIKYLHDGYDVRLLNEFTAKHCEKYPLTAVILLQKSILSARDYWWKPKDEDEEKILRNAMVSGNTDARKIAIDVINLRGEQGDFQWKPLLDLN